MTFEEFVDDNNIHECSATKREVKLTWNHQQSKLAIAIEALEFYINYSDFGCKAREALEKVR